jgi:NAD(P)-dependent dehydrogenase (short-subunit alcohol dehydrogenase family)
VTEANLPGGEDTFRLILDNGGDDIFAKADVTDPTDCKALVERTVEKYGRLDFACNNAGIGGDTNPAADYSIAGWHKVIAVNRSGVFNCMKYEIPEMLKSGSTLLPL